MDCYVEDGYWVVGYTDADVCGIGPVDEVRQPGGWLPIVYLDKNNRPIGLEEIKEQALEAVPESVEPQVEAAIEKIEAQGTDAAAFDAIAAQYRILAGLLAQLDDVLAMELQARAMEAARRAEDERDVEILMMVI
jgi:hypothetical protein